MSLGPFYKNSNSFRVLVVEDDPIIRRVHQEMLINLGCLVDSVGSGHNALRQLAYDMILLDIGLPDISGEEIIKSVRSMEMKPKSLPIVIVTAHGKNNKENYLARGANQVIRKPLNRELLQSLLASHGWQDKKDDLTQ